MIAQPAEATLSQMDPAAATPAITLASTELIPLAEITPVAPAEALVDSATIATMAVEPASAALVPVAAAQPAAPSPLGTSVASSTYTPLGTVSSVAQGTLPMLGALMLVVALILGLGLLVKRLQQTRRGQGASLQVKGGVQLGGKERVVWMQAGETHLLLGVSPGRVQTLHVFDVAPDFQMAAASDAAAEETAAPATSGTQEFSERLKALLEHARAKGLDVDAKVAAAPAVAAANAAPPGPARRVAAPAFSFRA